MNNYQIKNNCCLVVPNDTAVGKSLSVSREMIKRSNHKIQVGVTEKSSLLLEWKDCLIKEGFPSSRIEIIDSDHKQKGQTVIKCIMEWFDSAREPCQLGLPNDVLLITQKAIKGLSRISCKSYCDVYFDEIPQVATIYAPRVHKHPQVIFDHMTLRGEVSKIVSRITDENGKQVRIDDSICTIEALSLTGLKDELSLYSQHYNSEERSLLYSVLSENETVYTKKSSWDGIGEAQDRKLDPDGQTFFISMLTKRLFVGWASCTIISADFNTSLFKWWFDNLQVPIRFVLNKNITKNLLHNGSHPITWCERANIIYLLDKNSKQKWNSKKHLEFKGEDYDKLLLAKLADMGNPEFLLCTNKSRARKTRGLLSLKNCTVITSKDYGSNKFLDKDVVIFDAALNHNPHVESLLSGLGIPSEVIKMDMSLNPLYQIASRSSLRDHNSSREVTIICVDPASAEWLAQRFASFQPSGSLTIEHISGKRTKVCGNVGSVNKSIASTFPANNNLIATSSPPFTSPKVTNECFAQLDSLTIVPNQKQSNYQVLEMKPMEFISYMEMESQKVVHVREGESSQFCPGIFKEKSVFTGQIKKRRNKASFSHAYTLVLDFDGDSNSDNSEVISHHDFVNIFSPSRHSAKKPKHAFIIHNSFNRSSSNPNKFRVIMFLKRPVVTSDEYEACYEYVLTTLEDNGFPNSGLDPNSKNNVQIYWLPSVNANHTDYAFFQKYNCDEIRFIYKRYGLDVDSIISSRKPKKKQLVKSSGFQFKNKSFDLSTLINDYKSKLDNRRAGLLYLAMQCATNGGMTYLEVEQVLLSVVDTADGGMRKRVRDTMEQVSVKVHRWGARSVA